MVKEINKPKIAADNKKPLVIKLICLLIALSSLALLVGSSTLIQPESNPDVVIDANLYQIFLIAGIIAGILFSISIILPVNLWKHRSWAYYLTLVLLSLDLVYSLVYILTYLQIIRETGFSSFWIFFASLIYDIFSIAIFIIFRKYFFSSAENQPDNFAKTANSIISISLPFWTLGFISRAISNSRPGMFGLDFPVDVFRQTLWLGIIIGGAAIFLIFLAYEIYRLRNWARTTMLFLLIMGIMYYCVLLIFNISADIFAGEHVIALSDIAGVLAEALLQAVVVFSLPGITLFILLRYSHLFDEPPEQRKFVDRAIRYLLLATALSAIFIVFLIIVFTLSESWDSIKNIGLSNMFHIEYDSENQKWLSEWRPGENKYALIPMIIGSIYSTIGAVLIGVPLSLGAAVLLAEVAPNYIRELIHPAVELLAGIPSVIYGLFGMVVIAPLVRQIDVSRNTGYGLLTASIILAVMIIPTITNIAEDAIRAVPKAYKEGSLALGTTHWQTISQVIVPAARSGIIAAIILGIGRALGETMAVIMIIGNSIAIPRPLSENPLTVALSQARTLTGNVAVEIMYASGEHRSALFFTGVLLFFMIIIVNSTARFLMKERVNS